MSRIRTIKPELFVHDVLFDAEQHYGLPLRCAFMGLLTQCDRMGRFRWQARRLKPLILPYDVLDFAKVLNALAHTGFLKKYLYEGEIYGCIPSWFKHQRMNQREAESLLPGYEYPGCIVLEGEALEEHSPAFAHQLAFSLERKSLSLKDQRLREELRAREARSIPVETLDEGQSALKPAWEASVSDAPQEPSSQPCLEPLRSSERLDASYQDQGVREEPHPKEAQTKALANLDKRWSRSRSSWNISPHEAVRETSPQPCLQPLTPLESLKASLKKVLQRASPSIPPSQEASPEPLTQTLSVGAQPLKSPERAESLSLGMPSFEPVVPPSLQHPGPPQTALKPSEGFVSKPWLSKQVHARACTWGKEGKGKEGEWEQEGKGSLRGRDSAGGMPPTPPVRSEVPAIFEHWKTVMRYPQAQLDPKRRALISKALKLGYSSEQLCEAISGCSLTPHNQGHNDKGQRFDSLHVILGSADQIDRFRHNYHYPPRIVSSLDTQQAETIREMQAWVAEKQQGTAYESH